jgi:small subunit ribosomal protein S2
MSKSKITLEELLEAGAHFGHQSRRWNPKMKHYLYGKREGVHIFDLVQTKKRIEEAYEVLKDLVAGGKTVVFVGTKRQASDVIQEEASRAGTPYVAQRWLGGTITNWEQIRRSVKKLADLKEKKAAGEYKKYTKKENILIDREITRLEKFFGGLASLEKIPDALFVVDVKREEAAIKEARQKEILVVALVDSNSDPTLVDFVIPANDDALKTVKLVVSQMADAVIEGRQLAEKKSRPSTKSRSRTVGAKSRKKATAGESRELKLRRSKK